MANITFVPTVALANSCW